VSDIRGRFVNPSTLHPYPRGGTPAYEFAPNAPLIDWNDVTRDDVVRAIEVYDELGPDKFFSQHGFGPTTTYDLVWHKRQYPPKAILGAAYELAIGKRLDSGEFEGDFTIEPKSH
jgi:hypothetical protein